MTHDEIKNLLSAYCGGEISPAERAWVEEHLSSCRACRADVADLKTALRLIRNSPEVEPPPWMTARIITGILNQPEPSPSWLHRLFLPLRLKLPLEVAAILLVCVTGYYFTRDSSMELKQAIPQLQQPAETPPRTEQQSPVAELADTSAPARETDKAVPPDRHDRDKSRSGMPAAPEQLKQPAMSAPAPPTAKPEPDATAAVSSPKMETARPATEMRSTAKKAKKQGMGSDADGPVTGQAENRSGFRPVRIKVRLQMHDPSSALGVVRDTVKNSGGTVTGESSSRESGQLQARIPAARSAELLDRLERLGRITERPAMTESGDSIEIDISWK